MLVRFCVYVFYFTFKFFCPFTIGSWNARGAQHKAEDIENLCSFADVLGLQETRLGPVSRLVVPGFDFVDNQSNVAILISWKVSYVPLPLQICSGLDFCAISCWTGREWVAVVFLHVTGVVSSNDWDIWVESLPRPFVLGGDFNAHHWLWGSHRCSAWGKRLALSVEKYGLSIVQDGSPTFFRQYGGVTHESILDMFVCSHALDSSMGFTVSDDLRGSDHLPVLLSPSLSSSKQSVRSLGRRGGGPIVSNGDFGVWMNDWCRSRRPVKPRLRVRARPAWWTTACTLAVRDRRRSRRHFSRNPSEFLWFIALGVATETRYILRREKASFGARLCERVAGRNVSLSDVWRLLRPQDSRPQVTWVFEGQSKSILRGCALANAFNHHFASVFDSPGGLCPPSVVVGGAVLDDSVVPFTLSELSAALGACRLDSASGADRVTYSQLSCPDTVAQNQLLDFFQSRFDGRSLPPSWSFTVFTPVVKAGKTKSDITSYRPIALLSCARKVYERLLLRRLVRSVERSGRFQDCQYGFRSGRGAQDAILLLESGIREAWLHGKIVMAMFLDICAAYDTVVIAWVEYALHAMGVNAKLVAALLALLGKRRFVTRVNGYWSSERVTDRGLPQGSCLSPVLFAVVINDILAELGLSANIVAYADDVALWLIGDNVQDLTIAMQAVADSANSLLAARGLSLSPMKSELMVFARGPLRPASIHIGGRVVSATSSVRYLGVHLDSQLSWVKDAAVLKASLSTRLSTLKALASGTYPIKRGVLLKFYRIFIRSVVDFHLPFLVGSKVPLHSVQVAVNDCLRVVTGCLVSTPVQALWVEAGEMPIHLRAQELLVALCLRAIGRGKNDLVAAILADYCLLGPLARNELGSAGRGMAFILASDISRFPAPSVTTPPSPWVWCTSTIYRCILFSRPPSSLWSGVEIFCDASFHHGSWEGGIGICIPELRIHISRFLPKTPSAFVSELAAISVALDIILDMNLKVSRIYSDSASALQFLHRCFRKMTLVSPLAIEIGWKLFSVFNLDLSVSLCWVPGHAGIFGNELADDLADVGFQSRENPVSIPLVARDLRPVLRSWSSALWLTEWVAAPLGRRLFSIHPTVSQPVTLNSLALSSASVLSHLRTGHSFLNDHMYRLGWSQSPLCRCGKAVETVQHFLFDCSLWDSQRASLTLRGSTALGFPPHGMLAASHLRQLIRFCQSTRKRI